ncbi:GNAT family N-acetyltransferase [Roseibium denhamense]|uniref:N-acetylglutamate synthase, GNAT family n=1 Tax=Roseibium denhamense TaxID=76305 RepID=A0ABY1NB20_9HYPH|nr:GNAT family N-acetyltransferase [Roseibium denhamense]MTI06514.1 GNAT family N-acetyltransferase [Roseibium denhamense]SMP04440.1 N-acetylglutamate synthase, GNAT family [Roseibium denhamense]
MSDIQIRKAKRDDKAALTALSLRSKKSNGYADAFVQMCVEELTVRDEWILTHDFWVAETEGTRPAGCIRLSVEESSESGELETCFVAPELKGQGLGRMLFDVLLERARELGLSRIGLDADPFAEPFYARMGFKTVGKSPSGSIPGRFIPRMELELQTAQDARQAR